MLLVWWMCRECGLIVALNNHQNQLAMEQTHPKGSASSEHCHTLCVFAFFGVIYDNFLTSNYFQSKNGCCRQICGFFDFTSTSAAKSTPSLSMQVPRNLFGFAFLLHDNRAALSIEFMFVLLHHFPSRFRRCTKIITNYYRVIISRAHL